MHQFISGLIMLCFLTELSPYVLKTFWEWICTCTKKKKKKFQSEYCIQYYKLFLIGRFWSMIMILILESCTTVIPVLNVINKTCKYTFHIDTHNYPIRALNLFWLWLFDKMFLEYQYKSFLTVSVGHIHGFWFILF